MAPQLPYCSAVMGYENVSKHVNYRISGSRVAIKKVQSKKKELPQMNLTWFLLKKVLKRFILTFLGIRTVGRRPGKQTGS